MTSGRRFIVTGFGRTGSHWVADTLANVIGLPTGDIEFDLEKWLGNHTPILHCHDFRDFSNIDPSVREKIDVVWVRRKDTFGRAISMFVADHTNEWYRYSRKIVSPLLIPIDEFIERLESHVHLTVNVIGQVRPLFDRWTEIYYEEMTMHGHATEAFVAKKLGLDATTYYANYQAHKNAEEFRSPRSYRHIIENYQEIELAYRSWASGNKYHDIVV